MAAHADPEAATEDGLGLAKTAVGVAHGAIREALV